MYIVHIYMHMYAYLYIVVYICAHNNIVYRCDRHTQKHESIE